MENQDPHRSKIIRNLLIFALATAGSGWLGLAVDKATHAPDPQQGLGLLLWLIIPASTGLFLRALGGDGWRDAGLWPQLKKTWPWYVAALLIFPLISLVLLGVGSLVGAFSLPGFADQGAGAFVALLGAAFVPTFFKNIFEEMAWRGYLTPRFHALQSNPYVSHLLVGLIWASWHIPYWLYFVDVKQFTVLSVPGFMVVAVFALVVTTITYCELRLLSGSFWPGVLMHTVANIITATFLVNGFVKLNGYLGILFSPGNDGILHCLLFGAVGFGLYQYRLYHRPIEPLS